MTDNIVARRFIQTARQFQKNGLHQQATKNFKIGILTETYADEILASYGLFLFQSGQPSSANEILKRSYYYSPVSFEVNAVLGLAQAQSNDLFSAKLSLVRAAVIGPAVGDILFNLSQVAEKTGSNEVAYSAINMARVLNCKSAAVWTEFGIQEQSKGMVDKAKAAFQTAIDLDQGLAKPWIRMGILLATENNLTGAESAFRRALKIDPSQNDAIANLANVMWKMGAWEESRRILYGGLESQPLYSRFWSTVAALDYDQDRPAQGFGAGQKACIIDPTNLEGLINSAQNSLLLDGADDAVKLGARAVCLAPSNETACYNLGMYQLGNGQFEIGWKNFQFRAAAKNWSAPIGLPSKQLSETEAEFRRLLIIAEQGLGDEILFASCLPDIENQIENGNLEKVFVECDHRLIKIYERSFPRIQFFPRLITRESASDVSDYSEVVKNEKLDCFVRVGDLPGIFRNCLSEFGRKSRYLIYDEQESKIRREQLSSGPPERLIGLCWRSRKNRETNEIFYPPLTSLGAIFSIENATFVSLQYDDPADDIQQIQDQYGVNVVELEDVDLMNDIDSVATIIGAMDHVISANTSVYQLAGALGKPVSVLDYGSCWWYKLGTSALPWYPTVRYYGRMAGETWSESAEQIALSFYSD